ncbi:MAG TPA: redoxin family protein, partial [Actinomycetota bacterium]|nr:redoxin family protein [Actinomycetota bacterium]
MLAAIEEEFRDQPFVTIGVHSPKFTNERDVEMVREAVRRYAVAHPVLVDSDHAVWQQYGIRAWPTVVVVDPEGYIVAAGSGEPSRESLREAIAKVLDTARAQGTLSGHALPLRRETPARGSLAYPSKVVADADRIFIADTGHDQ